MIFKNLNPSALGISGHQSELIELALTYGFSGMDISITEVATQARLKGMPYARRLIDSAKIKIGSFVLPFELECDDEEFRKALGRLPEQAQVAAELGCTRATANVAPGGDKRPMHENFEFHRQRLAEICAALAPAGVRLGVGFQSLESLRKGMAFEFIHDLDALMQLINMVDAANLGYRLDLWEVFAAGGSFESIKKLPAAKVVTVIVAELSAEAAAADLNENSRLLPGDIRGRINVPEVLAAVAAGGYDGPVTPRVSRSAFASRKRDLVVKQAGDAMEAVWRIANLPAEPRRAVAISRE